MDPSVVGTYNTTRARVIKETMVTKATGPATAPAGLTASVPRATTTTDQVTGTTGKGTTSRVTTAIKGTTTDRIRATGAGGFNRTGTTRPIAVQGRDIQGKVQMGVKNIRDIIRIHRASTVKDRAIRGIRGAGVNFFIVNIIV